MEIFNQPLLQHYRRHFHGRNLSLYDSWPRQFSNWLKTKTIYISAWLSSFWRERGSEYEVKMQNKGMKKVWSYLYEMEQYYANRVFYKKKIG